MQRSSHSGRRPPLRLVLPSPELTFYIQVAARSEGPVLVLGCGTGRLAWELAQRGRRVVAVEPSESLLRAAESRRGTEPASVSARLELHRGDLRAVRVPETFAAVFAPHNAPALMDTEGDLESLFETARRHLAPQGLFALDVATGTVPGHPRPPGGAALRPGEAPRLAYRPHLEERGRNTGAGTSLRRTRAQGFAPESLDAALRAVGLAAFERYGQFDGTPFDDGDAMQVVVAALSPSV